MTVLADQEDLKSLAIRIESGPDLSGALAAIERSRQDDRSLGHALAGSLQIRRCSSAAASPTGATTTSTRLFHRNSSSGAALVWLVIMVIPVNMVATGLTYNFCNRDSDYRNGTDWHVDWAASKFLTKQLLVGAVGYHYRQITADSGSGAVLGAFRSRITAAGPQIGYIIPLGENQGYLNLKSYYEFEHENRPQGWNVCLTFALSPAEERPSRSPPPHIRK